MAFVEDLPASLKAPTPQAAAARQALAAWAANHGGHRVALLDLVTQLGEHLIAAGLPVWRVTCTLSDYHPEVVGRQYNWVRDRGPQQVDRRYTPRISDAYVSSPIRVIRDGAAALRRRLRGPGIQHDFPVLEELATEGASDYVAMALIFSDGTRHFIAFATDRDDGFRDDELAFLESLLPQLCLRIEVEHTRQLADQLVRVYLGSYAAPRVIGGEVRRIRGESIDAIILAVDMRGFTHLTDTLDPDAVFATLSVYYDAVSGPVIEAGGDVVKMIADGILAVFPVPHDADADMRASLADKAADAAKQAVASLGALAPEDLPDGAWPLRAGFALHAGEITFGNVGSRARLDFTLIGPAVNEAFRIEALTKEIGKPILLSAPFAALVRDDVTSLGFHTLKGVREPKEIFTFRPRA
ncbi:MAG: adenylate/guanylate cyclase domain-containing protein [Alphaproteobacteria bacterium]|nr:adenylate/guanylate cyclase domain-containing protein [Alphaproteobacteria bacterium]